MDKVYSRILPQVEHAYLIIVHHHYVNSPLPEEIRRGLHARIKEVQTWFCAVGSFDIRTMYGQ